MSDTEYRARTKDLASLLPKPAAADAMTQASNPAGVAAAPRAAWASWSSAANDLLRLSARLPVPGLSDVNYVEVGRARVL